MLLSIFSQFSSPAQCVMGSDWTTACCLVDGWVLLVTKLQQHDIAWLWIAIQRNRKSHIALHVYSAQHCVLLYSESKFEEQLFSNNKYYLHYLFCEYYYNYFKCMLYIFFLFLRIKRHWRVIISFFWWFLWGNNIQESLSEM